MKVHKTKKDLWLFGVICEYCSGILEGQTQDKTLTGYVFSLGVFNKMPNIMEKVYL